MSPKCYKCGEDDAHELSIKAFTEKTGYTCWICRKCRNKASREYLDRKRALNPITIDKRKYKPSDGISPRNMEEWDRLAKESRVRISQRFA